jgi:hypothetical protein
LIECFFEECGVHMSGTAGLDTRDVEAYEWVPTSNLARTVAEFARMQILVTLFDSDPDKWLDFIRRYGTADEHRDDVPFLLQLRERMQQNPSMAGDMRRIIREVTALFARDGRT